MHTTTSLRLSRRPRQNSDSFADDFLVHGSVPDRDAAVAEPCDSHPVVVLHRRSYKPDAVHLPNDPNHRRDSRRSVCRSQHSTRCRADADVCIWIVVGLRTARIGRRADADTVRYDQRESVVIDHHRQSAAAVRAMDARRDPNSDSSGVARWRPYGFRDINRQRLRSGLRIRTGRRAVLGARAGSGSHLGGCDKKRGARICLSVRVLDRNVCGADYCRDIRCDSCEIATIGDVDGVGKASPGTGDDRCGGVLLCACGIDDVRWCSHHTEGRRSHPAEGRDQCSHPAEGRDQCSHPAECRDQCSHPAECRDQCSHPAEGRDPRTTIRSHTAASQSSSTSV